MPGPQRSTPPKETPPESTQTPTPEQERIKQLEDQLARAMARKEVEAEEKEARAAEQASRYLPSDDDSPTSIQARLDPGLSKPGNILIHFTEDGFSALGKVWVRGEELEFEPGSPEYEATKDTSGKSWLDLDEGDQLDKYEKVMFRPGPWRGKSLAESKFERLAAFASEEGFDIPSTAELVAVERAARAKGRKPPLPSAR